MNKTLLVAGGTALVSLAAGAAGGYFFAKKRFDDELPGIIEAETGAIKKHYSVMLMEARSGKPADPADIPRREDVEEPEEHSTEDEDEQEIDPGAVEQLRERRTRLEKNATAALTDYQGISTRAVEERGETPAGASTLVAENVFNKGKDVKPARPPRGPDGKFRQKTTREQQNEPPELIDAETFLLNDPENDQETLLWFVNDRTLVLEANATEPVDINLVGEVNLTLFRGENSIYVRNSGIGTDYEVKLMTESVTAYIGLADGADEGEEATDPSAWV